MADFDDEKQARDLDALRKEEEEQLVAVLAESKYHLPYINLSRLGVDNEALRAVTEEEARSLKIAPFRLSGRNISIAVRSPKEELLAKLKEDMERRGLSPLFFMVSLASLEKVWERYKEV